MPKTLKEYLKEYGNHLRKYNKSECTVTVYCLAIKQLLCDVVADRDKDQLYELKYTPKTLTYSYLEDYVKRIKDGIKPNTQKTRLAGIKRYLKFIRAKYNSKVYDIYERKRDEFSTKDEDLLKARIPDDTVVRVLTRDELKELFDISKSNPRNHALLKVFHYTSQRLHSVINLNVCDIDFKPKNTKEGTEYYLITFRYLKGRDKKPKKIPVPPDCIESLKAYLEVREPPIEGYYRDNYRKELYHKDAVFLNGSGRRIKHISIYRILKRYESDLAINNSNWINRGLRPHLFRHSTISALDSGDMSDAEKKSISAHSKNSDAINTYKNAVEDNVIDKAFKVLQLNSQPEIHRKPNPIPQSPHETQPNKQQVQQPVRQTTEDKLIELYRDGKISKDEFLSLMGVRKDNQLEGYH